AQGGSCVEGAQSPRSRHQQEGNVGLPTQGCLGDGPDRGKAGAAGDQDQSLSLAGPEESGSEGALKGHLVPRLDPCFQTRRDLAIPYQLYMKPSGLQVIASYEWWSRTEAAGRIPAKFDAIVLSRPVSHRSLGSNAQTSNIRCQALDAGQQATNSLDRRQRLVGDFRIR